MNKSSKAIKIVCYVLLVIVCNSLFIQKVYSELTKQDIQEIRQIIREELEPFRREVNSRFEQMQTFMWMLVVIFIGITGVTIGFALWDRRTMIRPFETKVKQIDERIQIQEIEIGKVQKLILALRELANVDGKVKDVLAKFNLL